MISLTSSGSFDKTEAFLQKALKVDVRAILESCGRDGVQALSAATPKDTGKASTSWYYRVEKTRGGWKITWFNSDVEDGYPVAVMLQYGHGTGTGGYVQGVDYINPALKPIFEKITDRAWKAVIS